MLCDQIATLQDYIQDIHRWLPDYFYTKFIKEILHRLTGTPLSLSFFLSPFFPFSLLLSPFAIGYCN